MKEETGTGGADSSSIDVKRSRSAVRGRRGSTSRTVRGSHQDGRRPRLRPACDAGSAGDAGFTLVELLISVVITSLIVGAITTAVIISLNNQKTVSSRVSDSSSAQVTSAVYARDVQSAAYITTSGTTLSPAPCGSGTNFVLGLKWGSSSGGTVVSYWEDPTSGNLVRLYCTGGSSTPVSKETVARGLASIPQASVAPPAETPLVVADWTSAAGISSLTIGALESSSAFNFNLLAVPRLSESQNLLQGGNPASPALILLGSGATTPITCTGNGAINVHGRVFVDSTADPSTSFSGHPSFTATQIFTADPNTSNAFPAGTTPPPIYNPPQPDPYAGLVPPSTSGLPVYSDGAYHGPGVYTTKLSISGNTPITMQHGVYILQNGISLSGQASLTSDPTGVLLYVSGGRIDISGQGGVSLQPYSPPLYPSAPNLGIWQAQSDTNPVSLSGNGSANTFSGAIYAPGAQVGGTGNAGYTAGSVIAASLSCTGNATTNIG